MLLQKVKWVKGRDFIDGSPRYTFEGRDPAYTISRIQVVIYTKRERRFEHDSQSVKNYYYGSIFHIPTETGDTIGRFETVKEAKEETEKMFHYYCELFPEDTKALFF